MNAHTPSPFHDLLMTDKERLFRAALWESGFPDEEIDSFVRAVNSHEALLEVLSKAKIYISAKAIYSPDDVIRKAMKDLLDVIAQAEGRQP